MFRPSRIQNPKSYSGLAWIPLWVIKGGPRRRPLIGGFVASFRTGFAAPRRDLNPIWDFAGWSALSSLLGFVLMGFDKRRAMEAGWRISERTFFALAFVGGAFGILLGCAAFHHKNRKLSFISVILVCAILWLGGFLGLARLLGFPSG